MKGPVLKPKASAPPSAAIKQVKETSKGLFDTNGHTSLLQGKDKQEDQVMKDETKPEVAK
jgi:hypothetical protein